MKPRELVLQSCIVLLGALTFLPGLDWGLPSEERAALVLDPGQRNAAFYGKIADARRKIYERSGGNPNVELGRKLGLGEPLYPESFIVPEELLLLSYSSFLVRSRDPDEQRSLAALAQIKPHRLQFNPHYFVYGGLYLYSLGGWLGAAHVLGAARLVSDITYYYGDPAAMARIYLAGRAYSVLFGLAMLVCLCRLGESLWGPTAGAAAAALAALMPAIIAQAHLMKPHLPGTFFSMLCLREGLAILEGAPMRRYLLAGVWAGAAMSFNPIFAAFCGLAIGFAHLGAALPGTTGALQRRLLDAAVDRRFWAALAVFLGVYLATNPYVILAWSEYRAEIGGYQLGTYRFGGLLNVLLYWLHPIRAGLGTGLWALGTVALGACLTWGGRPERYLSVVVLSTGIYLGLQLGPGASTPETARYFLPGLAALSLVCVRAAALTAGRLRRPAWAAGALALLLMLPVPSAWATLSSFLRDDPAGSPASEAGEWVRDNLPAGTAVAIVLQAMPHVYSEPPFPFSRYRLRSLLPLLRNPAFKAGEPLPEFAVWGLNHGTFPRGDVEGEEFKLAGLGYEPFKDFGSGRNLLTTAAMPVRIYRRVR